ncbi:MAG: hypothetical protein AAF517_10055, partial [Planctomycetota bacterium]
MGETSTVTMVTFLLYIAGVFGLAAISHRLLSSRSFLGEYFLGSRGLGSWALAFTFAATAASGGSFTGYPSLIYSYGWVLALWIASYMIFPLTTMGVLGKRLNQVARKTGAITIPDVFRDRFQSPGLGILASVVIILFTIGLLIAQFKAGGIIIEKTFNLPSTWGYAVGLVIFAGTVIVYTAFGGFRAVVWTDVMQGIVMGIGVVILVPVVIWKAGGLEAATENIRSQPPMALTAVKGEFNDLALQHRGDSGPAALVYLHPDQKGASLRIDWPSGETQDVAITLATDANGNVTSTANEVRTAIEQHPQLSTLLSVSLPYDNDQIEKAENGEETSRGATGVVDLGGAGETKRYAFRSGDSAFFGPGRKEDGSPFHPIGMIFSFFCIWAITGIGQPGMMVRLMAFKDSKTLKRSILTVT